MQRDQNCVVDVEAIVRRLTVQAMKHWGFVPGTDISVESAIYAAATAAINATLAATQAEVELWKGRELAALQDLDVRTTERNDARAEVERLRAELTRCREEWLRWKATASQEDLQRDYLELEAEVSQLRARVAEAESRCSDYAARYGQAGVRFESLQDRIDSLESQLAVLELKERADLRYIDKLENSNARLKAQLAASQAALRSVAFLGTDCAPAMDERSFYRYQLHEAIGIATRALQALPERPAAVGTEEGGDDE